MSSRILSVIALSSLFSCSGEPEKEWTPSDTGAVDTDTDTDTEDTDTEDTGETAPPAVVPEEGTWGYSKPRLVSDPCGLDDYESVEDFVPEESEISDSNEDSFLLDGNSRCTRNDLEFNCETVDASEKVLGGSAELIIQSTMSGEIANADSMDITMDVNVAECKGAGCYLIELALTFPCEVQLTTTATAL